MPFGSKTRTEVMASVKKAADKAGALTLASLAVAAVALIVSAIALIVSVRCARAAA